MTDFLAALGLVLAIEGVLFAAIPHFAKKAAANIVATPEATLRTIGLISAVFGVAIVWLARG